MFSACLRWNQTVANNFTLDIEQSYSYGNKTLAPIAERMSKKYNISPPLDPTRYYWDMKYYFQYSYGNPLNEQLGCAYITQFVNSVEDYLNGKSRMVADLKFGHAFTEMIVLSTLKYTLQKNLYWTSTIYFEIYTSPGKDTLMRLVVNFEPYIIPGCDGEYCKWSKFKDILSGKINCDFDKLCAA
ncbi:17725_t:CDS:2 [Racocetra fulgida]|uniref:17725_t:CDS:1 n=1 Tax=Racocetra fulgida TaxID=60492 RepID=A0A9N9FG02_9GLOM|nr:17725_t:CDS:2 [Racocetra fulgida]